jgi:uncharacterized protein (TIGR02246 family)
VTATRLLATICVLTVLMMGASEAAGSPNAAAAIRALLSRSAGAWNRGDLTTFMRSYEESPGTLYVSSRTVIRGYANIRTHYAAGYKGKMGTLTISDVVVRPLGRDYAVAVARWHLTGAGGSRNTGLFTLVLHRTALGWKIITDHSP